MKSARTMCALAKATAIASGIRGPYGTDKILGFGITLEELRVLYAREGFPVQKKNSTVIMDHIGCWDLAGYAVQRGNMIFFTISRTSMEDLDAWNILSDPETEIRDSDACEYVGFDISSVQSIRNGVSS